MLVLMCLAVICVCGGTAKAAISRDGAGTGTTSFTLSGTSTNGLQLAGAWRSGSATCASTPAGWTLIKCVAISTNSLAVLCRVSATAASGTFTNATNVAGASYSGTAAPATSANCANELVTLNFFGRDGLAVCTTAANCGATTSTTVTWRALSNASGAGTDWYAGFLASSVPSFCAPTGMASRATTGGINFYDTGATATGFAGSTCSVTSGTWIMFDAEIMAASPACSSCTPSLIQNFNLSNSQSNSHTSLVGYFRGLTGAGNAIVCGYQVTSGSTTVAFTDDANDAFTDLAFQDDGGQRITMVYSLNGAGGARKITATPSASANDTQFGCGEYSGVATANATDGNCTGSAAGTTSTAVTCSSAIVTTANSDLIAAYMQVDNNGTVGNNFVTGSWTQGASPWQSENPDIYGGVFREYQVQAASGSITPAATVSPANEWNIIALALKGASAGTSAPTTPYVANAQHQDFFNIASFPSTSCLKSYIPAAAHDTMVAAYLGGVGTSSTVYGGYYAVVDTTDADTITSGSHTVTPAQMSGITTTCAIGVDVGANYEVVTPSAVTGTTFTATFAKAHTATWQITGITDDVSEEWDTTGAPSDFSGGASGILELFYAANVSSSGKGNHTLTISMANFATGSNLSDVLLFDVPNLATSNVFDTTAGQVASNGNCTTTSCPGAGQVAETSSITPTVANEICFGMMGVQSSTLSGVSPGYFLSAFPTPVGANDPTDDNNGWMLHVNPPLSAQTYTWTNCTGCTNGGAVQNWAALRACFLPPASFTPQFNKQRRLDRLEAAAQ